MMDPSKYAPGYFNAPGRPMRWVEKDRIERAPAWCSVDLRDGNQSLIVPMSLEEKLEFYRMLVKAGFKEIEVGFPAASETEYEFLRTLIEQDMIPPDVTVQVLAQCREHIIRKTFEACKGAPSAIIHIYNSVSVAQREQVFRRSRQEIMDIAVEGARLVKGLAAEYEGNFRFEYSPESFTGAEPEYALAVCNAVLDVLEPSEANNVIINLPVTVEMSLPHIYASQVEYMSGNLKYREHVTLSVHPHNDRGTGVADTELALLAGADRVEGTLFGNGERTGNVDIVTLAMNMYSHGVDPRLDFSDMPALVKTYEKCTRMRVHDRSPYAGALVFAAFSGSHQDAINKGTQYMKESNSDFWEIPYLPIDPADVGRAYEPIIRINSQSGKGGAAYIMEHNFGYDLPKTMHPELGSIVQKETDRVGKEIAPERILELFQQEYVEATAPYQLLKHAFTETIDESGHSHVAFQGTLRHTDTVFEVAGQGNGPIDAFFNAIKDEKMAHFTFLDYKSHAITDGSDSQGVAYILLQEQRTGKKYWGVGLSHNINLAPLRAILSAVNRSKKHEA